MVVVVLAVLVMAPMGEIQTEVPPAIQMEELKQRRDGFTVLMDTLVQVVLDQVVMQVYHIVVVVVEVVTMEVERDSKMKVVEEDLLTAIGLFVPLQYIQSLLFVVMERST